MGLDGDPCDSCRDVYEIDDLQPPCGSPECSKPAPLFLGNAIPWRIWQTLNQFDRPTRTEFIVSMAGAQSLSVPMLLPSVKVFGLCESYGQSTDAAERILKLEAELFPLVYARWERNRDRDKGGGDVPPEGEE